MTIAIDEFVQREIIYCVSSLVSALIKAVDNLPKSQFDDGTSSDDLYELTGRDDWETPVEYYLDNSMARSDLIEALDKLDVKDERAPEIIETAKADLQRAEAARGFVLDDDDMALEWAGISDKELRFKLMDYLRREDEFEDFARDHDIDPERDEVYEHWIVSGWLANRLEEKGEVVGRDICGLTIWGRCTTGQAISMDWVIGEIYRELTAPEA